jgi:cell division septation protein DedD
MTMRKNTIFFCILILVAVLGNAQTIDRSRYREITLPRFEAWKQEVPREGTEPIQFKAQVLFEELSGTTLSFADPDNQTSIYFTADKTWPEMPEGQPVTIYFTASGSWSWNRVLDEIDIGSPLAQDPAIDDPADEWSEEEDLALTEYDFEEEEPEFDEFEDDSLAEAEDAGTEEEYPAAPRQRQIPPASPPSRTRQPPARTATQSFTEPAKIIGTAPKPGKVYRLQVGAYAVQRNAIHTLDRLREAGFNPAYERYGAYLRVVISGVRGADVTKYVERIGQAGFTEVWCREEH